MSKIKRSTKGGVFSLQMDEGHCRDSGMALVLLLLLISLFTKNSIYYKIAIPVLIADMTSPRAFYPFAIVWYGLSNIIGIIVSKLLLSMVFFLLVTPVGILRRILGKDSLNLKEWKKGSGSVMKKTKREFSAADMEKPT